MYNNTKQSMVIDSGIAQGYHGPSIVILGLKKVIYNLLVDILMSFFFLLIIFLNINFQIKKKGRKTDILDDFFWPPFL